MEWNFGGVAKRKREKGKKEPKMTNEFCLLELPLINSLYDYKK